MGRIEVRALSEPEETIEFSRGRSEVFRLAGTTITRDYHEPGWNWTDDVQPIAGTSSCQYHHRGIILRGRMGVRSDEGEEAIIGPDEVYDVAPGHVGWVEGDDPLVTLDWAGTAGWASPASEGQRVLATILFTDVVDSTRIATRLGDAAWRRARALHDDTTRSVLTSHRGREIETAGDSFLAVFDGAARAIRCGLALVRALDAADLPIRVGVHSGEVEFVDDGGLRGLSVHAAARVMALAGAGEVLVSSTTRELAEGSGLAFVSRGRHVLKGLEGEREIFAADDGGPHRTGG